MLRDEAQPSSPSMHSTGTTHATMQHNFRHALPAVLLKHLQHQHSQQRQHRSQEGCSLASGRVLGGSLNLGQQDIVQNVFSRAGAPGDSHLLGLTLNLGNCELNITTRHFAGDAGDLCRREQERSKRRGQ